MQTHPPLQPNQSLARLAINSDFKFLDVMTTASGYEVWVARLDIIDGEQKGSKADLVMWYDLTGPKFKAICKTMLDQKDTDSNTLIAEHKVEGTSKQQLMYNIAAALRDYDFVVRVGLNKNGYQEIKDVHDRCSRVLSSFSLV